VSFLKDPDQFRTVVVAWLATLTVVLGVASPFLIQLALLARKVIAAFEKGQVDVVDSTSARGQG
jgi:hypothetical protein